MFIVALLLLQGRPALKRVGEKGVQVTNGATKALRIPRPVSPFGRQLLACPLTLLSAGNDR